MRDFGRKNVGNLFTVEKELQRERKKKRMGERKEGQVEKSTKRFWGNIRAINS